MKVLFYTDEIVPSGDSIFLAGPTPRSSHVRSWRPDAISVLSDLGFKGNIFVPETENDMRLGHKEHYDGIIVADPIGWEWKFLEASTVIMFWVPRDHEDMPAFTTNIEWGMYFRSGKVVLGFPRSAIRMGYFAFCCNQFGISMSDTIEKTARSAIELIAKIKNGSVIVSPIGLIGKTINDSFDSPDLSKI